MSTHKPTYRDLISAAIRTKKGGMSLPGIKTYLNLTPSQHRYVNAALRKGVETGAFVMNKTKPGHYRLNPQNNKACTDPTKRRDPTGTRCRPGYRTPCKSPEQHRRRKSSRTTTKGGRIYECVKRRTSRTKSRKKRAKYTLTNENVFFHAAYGERYELHDGRIIQIGDNETYFFETRPSNKYWFWSDAAPLPGFRFRQLESRLIGGWWGKKKKKAAKEQPVVLCDDCIRTCMRAALNKTPKQAGPGIPRIDTSTIVLGCKKECHRCQKK